MRIEFIFILLMVLLSSCDHRTDQSSKPSQPTKFREIRHLSGEENEFDLVQKKEALNDSVHCITIKGTDIDFERGYHIPLSVMDTLTYTMNSRSYKSHLISKKHFTYNSNEFIANAFYIEELSAQDTDEIIFTNQDYKVYKVEFVPSRNTILNVENYNIDSMQWGNIASWEAVNN